MKAFKRVLILCRDFPVNKGSIQVPGDVPFLTWVRFRVWVGAGLGLGIGLREGWVRIRTRPEGGVVVYIPRIL